MGAALQVLNAGAIHTVEQSKVEANRLLQAAHNRSEMTLAEAKKTVQTANNAASDVFAAAQRKVQGANNDASALVVGAQRRLQGVGNDVASKIRGGKIAVQKTFNDQAIKVAEAKKVLQKERNNASAVSNDVALWTASLSNQKRMTQMGTQVNQITDAVGVTLDGATTGRAFDRIAHAEALGSTIAMAAAAGMGGSTVENYNGAMNLRQALKEDQEDRQLTQKINYAKQQQKDTMRGAVDGMGRLDQRATLDHEVIIPEQDNSAIMDESNYDAIYNNQDYSAITAQHDFEVFSPNLDYTVYQDHKKMSPFQQIATVIGAGVATYYGGPQAGMAVFSASQGINDMQNGNFAGAQGNFNSAFTGGMGGLKTWQAGATNPSMGAGEAWGKNVFSSPKTGANLKG